MVACFLCESVYICSDGDDMKKGFKGLLVVVGSVVVVVATLML